MPRRVSVHLMLTAALAAYLGGLPLAGATTLKAFSFEELVLNSDCVVTGSAASIETFRDAHGRVVRSVRFSVDEYVAGAGPKFVTVKLLGGRIGNYVHRVLGEAELTVGAPVLLFLEQTSGREANTFVVTGMAQGRFGIVRDENTKQRFAIRELGDVNLVDDGRLDDESMGRDQPCTSTYIPLDRLIAQIRKIASR